MKKSKKVLLALLSVALLFLIVGIFVIGNLTAQDAKNISLSMPDLSDMQNGEYIGEYSIAPVFVKVEVSIYEHQITNITILQHDKGLGTPAERIVNDVVDAQSLDIDAVSGATVSSKCILKAIENALETGGLSK